MPKKAATKKTENSKSKSAARSVKKAQPSSVSKEEFTDFSVNEEKTMSVDNTSTPQRPVRVHKLTLIIALVIILLGVLLYYGRGYVVAAVVNGQPISRLELVKEAEKESGKQAMTTLIRNALVSQEASKKNIKVSDKEVSDQIKTIENNLSQQGQKLDQMLALEGMTRQDLNKIVYQDLLVTKLVGSDIKISDKDVNDYISKNKDFLPKDKKGDDLKNYARDQLKKAQLPQKAQAWLAQVEKNAKIIKFVNY